MKAADRAGSSVISPANARIVRRVWSLLRRQHPHAGIELKFENRLELLVAVMLSAQCTDKRVNQVTATLFRKFRKPDDYLAVPRTLLEKYLHPLGFFRQKALFLQAAMRLLRDRHAGRVPGRMDALTKLPGIGRKSANVILANGFGRAEGIAVDTHVQRVAQRLGWTDAADPDAIEQDLLRLFPRRDWGRINHVLVFHGRYICRARRPDCVRCSVRAFCRDPQAQMMPANKR